MRNRATRWGTALALSTVPLWCWAFSKHERLVFADSQMAPYIQFQFAVYLLPEATSGRTGDPQTVATGLLAKKYSIWKITGEFPKEPKEMLVRIRQEDNVPKNYAPPEAASLPFRGHGLNKDQEIALQKTRHALILDFGFPKKDVWTALRSASEFAEELARQTGGLIWDEEARAIFSTDAWHQARLDGWQSGAARMSKQTTIDIYENGEFVRAVTMGMAKVGLPDVVIEEASRSSDAQAANLINLVAQSMAEGHLPKENASYKIDIRSIQNASLRDSMLAALKPNATGAACIDIKWAAHEEGDPDNELIEIGFGRYTGNDVHAKQEAALSWLFGWEDSAKQIKHTDELLAESQKERAKLPTLETDFGAGLRPGENILLKAPFVTSDGGNEWMWVEVHEWKDGKIKGLLDDQPEHVPGLHSGQVVEIKEAEVFDYIRHFPDGHDEGNTTRNIIEKMQGRTDDLPTKITLDPPPSCND